MATGSREEQAQARVYRESMRDKLGKVREQGYITKGKIHSLTSFFALPKGTKDVGMVYHDTKLGLNDAIWVPRFPLPTFNTML
jgi:hypothetical protein